ncbi:MAG: plasmid recombination protein [Solobacterium sp.]|nr:plasmid recombination protein [Solobacterium sp.]
MAHCEKYKRADTSAMFIHYERMPDHQLSNKDIDTARSHLNYNVAANDQPLPQHKFLAIRLKQIQTNNRKNQNVVCDWVITQPRDVKEQDSRAFFLAVYKFASERYGKENVVSAYVHMDEIGQTPHMHFCFMPVEKLEDGTKKLNAKVIVDRAELQQFHPDLQKAIDEALGYHVSITSGITREQGGNKTVKQLKEETARKEKIPQGKKKVLSSDLTYTADESKQLHELAADGISFQIQKKDLIERQKKLERIEQYYSDRLAKLQKQEHELSDLMDQTEEVAATLGAPDAKSYITINQENAQLHNKVELLEDDIRAIGENVGSEILQVIPLKKTDINYNALPQRPSRSVMRVIRKFVDEALSNLHDKLERIVNRVWTALSNLIENYGISGNREIRSIKESLHELTDKHLFSSDRLLPTKPSQEKPQNKGR